MKTYIVTRIIRVDPNAVPNLGVHHSAKAADAHFESLIRDRIERGSAKLMWRRDKAKPQFPGDCRRRALMVFPNNWSEELKIEVW